MTDTTSRTPVGEYTSVEAAWRATLQQHGATEDQADNVVTLVFGDPRLTRGAPADEDAIRSVVEDRLAEVDYESVLDADADMNRVRRQLWRAVDAGLGGQIGGPASAPPSIARSGLSGAGSDEEPSATDAGDASEDVAVSTESVDRQFDHHQSVEAAWRSVLADYGADPDQADNVVQLTFGLPALTRGAPTRAEIRRIVADRLVDLDLESVLETADDVEAVRAALLAAVEAGLDGRLAGPASAPREIALDDSEGTDTGLIDEPTADQKTMEPRAVAGARAERASAATGAADPTETQREIKAVLAELLDEYDHWSLDDLEVAVELLRAERSDSSDGDKQTDERQ